MGFNLGLKGLNTSYEMLQSLTSEVLVYKTNNTHITRKVNEVIIKQTYTYLCDYLMRYRVR
jgi:hypothetical protein